MAEVSKIRDLEKNNQKYLIIEGNDGYSVYSEVNDNDYNYAEKISPNVVGIYDGKKYVVLGFYDFRADDRFRAVSDVDFKLLPDNKLETFRSAFNSKINTLYNTLKTDIDKIEYVTVSVTPQSQSTETSTQPPEPAPAAQQAPAAAQSVPGSRRPGATRIKTTPSCSVCH